MRVRWILATVALLCAAGSSATASAKTLTNHNIVSPSKQISCYAVQKSTRIECMAPYIKRVCECDPLLSLTPRGKSKLAGRTDFPGFATPRRTLGYGDTWKRPGIRCTMRTTGMTCRNLDNHGFHLQRGNVRHF